jgi:hypothetical protein
MAGILSGAVNLGVNTTNRRATRIISTSIIIITSYFFMFAYIFTARIAPVICTSIAVITSYRSFNPTPFRITITFFARGQIVRFFIPTTPGRITMIISAYTVIITVNIFIITSSRRVARI